MTAEIRLLPYYRRLVLLRFNHPPSPPHLSSPQSKLQSKMLLKQVFSVSILMRPPSRSLIKSFSILKHPQKGGKAKTSNSNSIKRGREEMEQGGPSEDRQTKKHHGRIIIPPRVQSLRYDSRHIYRVYWLFLYSLKDASYRNKHVTIRPR